MPRFDAWFARMLLAIYLNDHLAGATVGRELARRAAASNRGSSYEPFLQDLSKQVQEDRESLLQIMSQLDVAPDRLKVIAGWTVEKLGRLKFNGRLTGYSPLSRLVELDGLALGVHGKLALWLTLEQLAPEHHGLADVDLAALIERARRQLEELEAQRLRASTDAFS